MQAFSLKEVFDMRAGLVLLRMLTGRGSIHQVQENPAFVRARLADMEQHHPASTIYGGSLSPDYIPLVDVTSDIWPPSLVLHFSRLGLMCVEPPGNRPTMQIVVELLQQQVNSFVQF